MSNASSVFNNICDKLRPYVSSALKECPEKEPVLYSPELAEMPNDQLEKLIEEEVNEEIKEGELEEEERGIAKGILHQFYDIFRTPPDPKRLHKVRTQTCTEIIATSWSEALRWAYKENNNKPVKLRDCLLPDDLGRSGWAWRGNINHTGFSQEQVEDLLRKFGKEEISDKFELSWGGYVKRIGEGYKLCKSEEVK